MQIISRKDAKAQGLKRYFTGVPCKHAHVADRYEVNGQCSECRKIVDKQHYAKYKEERKARVKSYQNEHKGERAAYSKQYNAEHKEEQAAYRKQYSAEHKEKIIAYGKQYYKENKEEILIKNKVYRKNNPNVSKSSRKQYYKKNKLKIAAHLKEYHKNNRHIMQAITRKRWAAKRNRSPIWADNKAIKMIYEQCPINMEVDHILPFQGELVSGLHVADNMQYLNKSDNLSKSNKTTPELFAQVETTMMVFIKQQENKNVRHEETAQMASSSD